MSNSLKDILSDLKNRMTGTLDSLKRDFSGLRSGRASPNLLEPVKVEAYGSVVPLGQVGSITVSEARMLTVSVWDQSLVAAAEKAIRDSGLGLNPASEGQVIRVPVPQLTEERRQEMAKAAARYAENARIAVRNVRRDGMGKAKSLEKNGDISQDDLRDWEQSIQKLTDEYISLIDKQLLSKEKDIKQV